MKSKFVIGDKVKVINYGHPICMSKNSGVEVKFPVIYEDDKVIWYDMNSGVVGKVGVVTDVKETQGMIGYSLSEIAGKTAWYDEDQLEIIVNKKL